MIAATVWKRNRYNMLRPIHYLFLSNETKIVRKSYLKCFTQIKQRKISKTINETGKTDDHVTTDITFSIFYLVLV